MSFISIFVDIFDHLEVFCVESPIISPSMKNLNQFLDKLDIEDEADVDDTLIRYHVQTKEGEESDL